MGEEDGLHVTLHRSVVSAGIPLWVNLAGSFLVIFTAIHPLAPLISYATSYATFDAIP